MYILVFDCVLVLTKILYYKLIQNGTLIFIYLIFNVLEISTSQKMNIVERFTFSVIKFKR